MKKIYKSGLMALIISVICLHTLNAQCKIDNIYFQSGEVLEYDLHFKWGLISKKSGWAKLKTLDAKYNGQDVYKISLSSASTGTARSFFKLNDTISCVLTKDLVPLAFTKDAHEDDDYTKERVTYNYSDGKIKTRSVRHKNGNFKFDETFETKDCIYDMMSIVFYARTLDYGHMRKGDKVNVNFISGKKRLKMTIVHDGTEKLKVGDDNKYNTIRLVLKISDDAFENSEEAMKVYITNDNNRLPIRIDSKLKVGNARVILKSFKGNKHPVNRSN
ncbi:MAG: DUF3108 domain-containing protein [Dysgonomonas sp.]